MSEIVKPLPEPSVVEWFSRQTPRDVYITAITQAGILYGVELLPKGRRRNTLHSAMTVIFEQTFAGRVPPFDEGSAHAFAMISAGDRARGRTVGELDAQIAAIVLSRGASLATRNTKDFLDCGVELINPGE